jgi:phosphatidylserine/phosphatidylglycerophosphate/cardiolipin synthase-like enzyme
LGGGEGVAGEETIEDLVTRVGRARWTSGNSVELMADPRQAWRARLELTDSARHHILISTFSWHNDHYGKAYREYLMETVQRRRAEGTDVTVRVLADASALGLFSPAFEELEREGAKVRGFNRSSWGLTPLYEGRMHDKIMVVDGREALVGGRNFANDYFDPQKWWLDLGVRVRGPVVDDLQMIFLKSWEFTEFNRKFGRFLLPQEMLLKDLQVFWSTGRYPNGNSPLRRFLTPEYFPHRTGPEGDLRVAVLYDNPLLRRRAATTDLLIALAGRARERMDIMTPFPNMPDDLAAALERAAARGVKVRLIVNGREAAIRGGPFLTSGLPTLIRLIEAGAEVWAWRANGELRDAIEASGCNPELMPPVALHGKMFTVDDRLSVIHSSNFNIRSTYYNTEAGVAVLDRDFNQQLGDLIDNLIDLHDFRLQCGDGDETPAIPMVMDLWTTEDIPMLREMLGGKQRFLDAWSVAW